MSAMAIIVIRLPAAQVVRFQGMLDGEDGLATLRCGDSVRTEQQLWTTRNQVKELQLWLSSLPASLHVEVVREEI